MKIFFHILDLTVVNAWLLYQLEFKRTHLGEKHLDLYHFKRSISEVWIKNNSSRNVVLGRELRHGTGRLADQVPTAIRFNGMWHLPHCFSGYYDRHRCRLCKAQTNVFCMTCEVFLCCMFNRNCYIPWHTEDKGRLIRTPPAWLVVPDDETENDSDSDTQNTQSVHSNPNIDPQNTQIVPYLDSDAE